MALIDVNWKPGAKELRQFALLFFAFATAFGLFGYFFKDWPPVVPWILWGAAVVVGLAGVLAPAIVRPLYVVMMAVALPIGMVVSTVLMVLIFYLVLTPIGWIMGLSGHDPMQRRFDRAAATYWIERRPPANVGRYFRQY